MTSSSFFLRFKNGQMFKQLVDICKDIVQDVNLEITSQGMTMQAMDSSHVSLIQFFIDKDDFEEYFLSGKDFFCISLSLKNLNLILKCFKENYKLTFAFDDKDVLQINFNYTLDNSDSDEQYSWNLNLMNIETEKLQIPEEEEECKIMMDGWQFYDMIKNISIVNESLDINVTGKVVNFEVQGDIGKVNFCKSFTREKMSSKHNLRLQFSMRYIVMFSKAHTFSRNLEIQLRNEQPMQLLYSVGNSWIRFFLAPKFDD